MQEKKSKLINIKGLYILIGPICLLLISLVLIILGLMPDANDIFAELLMPFLLWLLPLCSFVCTLVGLKSYKAQKKLNISNPFLLMATIFDIILIIAPIAFVVIVKVLL